MRHPRLLHREDTVLLVVDVQEAFVRVMPGLPELGRKIAVLIEGAGILGVPVVVTEQYPRGLGSTIEPVKNALEKLSGSRKFEKDCFSCCGATDFMSWLDDSGRRQVIVCGIEAHVCVNQTCHDLIHRGYSVHLVTDAVESRIPENKRAGIDKILGAGAVPSSVEMALFEMLVRSGTEEFKAVQKLVK
ncbi:MAG: isochorismatase family protein [Candidatus Melainabacteria bacterium]|nr:isochorismatase family protein [Candidatus Melainabacteria bacterium]